MVDDDSVVAFPIIRWPFKLDALSHALPDDLARNA
jgi:hypothetical protein